MADQGVEKVREIKNRIQGLDLTSTTIKDLLSETSTAADKYYTIHTGYKKALIAYNQEVRKLV